MKKLSGIFILYAVILTSCQSEMFLALQNKEVQKIYASTEADPFTKNIIDDNTLETGWLSGDAINVFFGASESRRFVSSESGSVAQFKGSIDVVTGGGEGLNDDTCLWGIYPYDPQNTCDGSSVTLTLPHIQASAENTFADGIFPQIARSRNFYMTFYNLCGCFRFTVAASDIKSVTLAGNNDEPIAGRAKVLLEKVPEVERIISSQTKITVAAPAGEYFKPGVHYYIVLYPTTFTKGLTLTYHKDEAYATYTYMNEYTLSRNKVSRFKDKDAGLTFIDVPLADWGDGDHIQGEI